MIFMAYKTDMEPQVKRVFSQLTSEYRGFPVRVSMGIACAEDCDGSYDTLFYMADTALYAAKRGGRGTYKFYEESMEHVLAEATDEEGRE